MFHRPTSRDDFRVAIICAKQVEYDAISLLIDEWYDTYEDEADETDSTIYDFARMGKTSIVKPDWPVVSKKVLYLKANIANGGEPIYITLA